RKRYSQRKMKGVHPLDKSLNLGKDQFSDGVRLRLAEQINHSAYDHVAQQIAQTTGAQVAKRQCLNLVQDMAQDFEDYYLQNRYL
ncbi:ISKra4 family transposase, partial [Vibrio sp. SG41-7]|nr:ISKra4 family transposase [Vibrio sp. SG41-7]